MVSHLSLLPISLALVTVVTFIISYVIAAFDEKVVYPWWPYISDTGSKPPESCIFGQLLNISAFLALATVFVRYKLVQAFNNHTTSLVLLNKVALAFGFLSSVGVSLVANFQESNVISVHVVGAGLAFGLGVVYCFLQSAITRKMYPMYNGYSIFIHRMIISHIALLALILTILFGMLASSKKSESAFSFDTFLWNRTDPGFDEHIVSTTSEWLLGLAFLSFFLTYVSEFRKITMRILPELLVSHLDETPIIFTNHGPPTERTGLLA